MVSLTSSSGGYINGRNSANLEILIDKTSSTYVICHMGGYDLGFIKTNYGFLWKKIVLIYYTNGGVRYWIYWIMSPPTLVGRHIVFVLSVCLSVRLSITQFVSATPLKLLNRISWNLVDSKDTICSCAYNQEILIAWILWELCPFELRNFPKFTTEVACRRNSSETTEQNFMKLGR